MLSINYKKGRIGIRRKVTSAVCLVGLILITTGISVGYFFGFNLLTDTTVADYDKMAQLLVYSIAKMVEKEIEHIEVYSDDLAWKDMIAASNAKYGAMISPLFKTPLLILNSFSPMEISTIS